MKKIRTVINTKPEFSKLPAKLDPKAKTSPFKMNPQVYEWIRDFLKAGGDPNRVNEMIPGRPDLMYSYLEYHNEYDRIKQAEYGQDDYETLKNIAKDMEESLEFALSLKRKAKGSKRKSEHKYKIYFDFLDDAIELISNLIYLGYSPKFICMKLSESMPGITPMIYSHWKDETDHVDELIFAYKASGEEFMHSAKDFMEEWLDPNKHPELGVQHVGLVREIGLWKQRMAEFMDRKKFGKRIEIFDETPQKKYLEGKDLDKFLEGLEKARFGNPSESDEKKEEEKSEESEYTEFEEL